MAVAASEPNMSVVLRNAAKNHQSMVNNNNQKNSLAASLHDYRASGAFGLDPSSLAPKKNLKSKKHSEKTSTVPQQKPENVNLQPVTGFNSLPLIHDLNDVVMTKDQECALCLAAFRSIKEFRLLSKKHHNCMKCGISVCEDCSQHKIQLSLHDAVKYRTCNRCFCKMQNEALINFYHGLYQAKTSQISSLDTRRQLIKERILHFETESQLIEREMQQNSIETDEEFGKLLDEYKRGNDQIIALKEKQQNMTSLQIVEEDQIRARD